MIFLPEEARKAIELAAKQGKDVEIRRKGTGYIVMEVKKTIIYRSPD